jgi:DNA-sulfur modification-associated
MSVDLLNGKVLTGYHREDTFIATRKYMGGRPVFHLDMCIAQLTAGVDAPPVGVAQDDNRIVKENRGRLFRDYVNSNHEWASPSLLLWCPIGILNFESLPQINDLVNDPSVVLGVLSVPRNSRQSIKILDGQHRILGFHLWMDQLNKELQNSKMSLAEATKAGQSKVIEIAKERVERAEENLERSIKESIGIDILICSSAKEARQIFADIANNAQGMVKALAIGFDQSKLVNRVTSHIASDFPHPLLDGRVDFNKDRIAKDSGMLISAKTLADSVRALSVGISGRISRVQELEWSDEEISQRAKIFLDALQSAFKNEFSKPPADFRQTSLLSSGTMFRVLAGVWFELTSSTNAQGKAMKPRMTVAEATKFFSTLAPHMQAPLKPGNKWLTTGVFPSPSNGTVVMAPASRNQDLKKLTLEITNWALDPNSSPF